MCSSSVEARSESAISFSKITTDISGLAMSAQLKHLGVSNLILERDSKVGGVWIDRYEYLSLHAPHYADHLPFVSTFGHHAAASVPNCLVAND